MTLSSSFGETLSYSMTIGKAGQQPRSFLTGVPCVQRSSRLRRDGDANMRYRHLRQTCTSCHSKLVCSRKTPRPRSVLHRSNISSRTQPGSVWIDVGFLWFWSVPCTSQQPFHVPNGELEHTPPADERRGLSPSSGPSWGSSIGGESAPEAEWRGMVSVDMGRMDDRFGEVECPGYRSDWESRRGKQFSLRKGERDVLRRFETLL